MKTERISVNLIDENEYNPNEMDENHYLKLVQNIKRKGFRKPIEVRKNGERYTIVDGAHRFRACKELGYTEVECIVDDIDITEAMVDTLNANIHGSHNPYKEALMFKQIHERYTLQDIEKLTVFNQIELKDRMDLLGLMKFDVLSSTDVPILENQKIDTYVGIPLTNQPLNAFKIRFYWTPDGTKDIAAQFLEYGLFIDNEV